MTKDFDLFLQYEEEFHGSDRKLSRLERKIATKQDRSRNKKTDQDQLKKQKVETPSLSSHAKKGRVLSVRPEEILVDIEGKTVRCQMRGALKKGKQQLKALVTIGDFVFIEPREEETGVIVQVEPRSSFLSRADNLLRRKEQLIAANIDQVLIVSSARFPALKPALIDRYIIAAKKGNMQPVIVINKIDLLEEEDKEFFDFIEQTYLSLSIPFLKVSTVTGEGLSLLKKHMEGKTSVFSGQSGTGKSSLINAILGKNLKTGQVTEKTLKGSHTTTSAVLVPLEGGGFCVDTPGIRSFGVWDLESSDVEGYFPEIKEAAACCKFPGCSHAQEPGCYVQEALEKGTISPLRFASFLSLLQTVLEKHKTR